MVTPAARSEVVELFNRHFGKDVGALYITDGQPELHQAIWRLRSLDRRQPNDVVVKATLAGLLLQTGQFAEARQILDIAWHMRDPRIVPVQALIAKLYATMGKTERALALMREIIAEPELRRQDPALNNAAHLAFLAGDAAFLADISRYAAETKDLNVAGLLLATLEANGLTDHLAGHQQIVFDLVRDVQCGLWVSVLAEEDWPPLIAITSYVTAPPADRRRLEREMVDRLADYYESRGLAPGAYFGYFGWHLVPAPIGTALSGTAA